MLFIDDFLHDLVLRLMILLSEYSHYYFSPGKVCYTSLKIIACSSMFDCRINRIFVDKSKVGCLYSLRNPLAIPFG